MLSHKRLLTITDLLLIFKEILQKDCLVLLQYNLNTGKEMNEQNRPIGSLNGQVNPTRTHFDYAHGNFPDHVDLTVNIGTGISGCGAHKIRVDKQGNIITDELT